LIVDSEASLIFSHNSVGTSGGAVLLQNRKLIATTNAKLNFSSNSASYGGALVLRNSIAQVNTDGISSLTTTKAQMEESCTSITESCALTLINQ
jgi:hypothetical protein